MNNADFTLVADLLHKTSGLAIGQDKIYLLESRLTPLARKRGLEHIEALIGELRKGKNDALVRDVTEAMTTNESYFFRDNTPFELFRKTILPQLIANRKTERSLKIWSAACSTGQEAYSLAMILREESAALSGFRMDITGTDLSNEVLEKAKSGIYSQFEVQRGLPIDLITRYFTQSGSNWQIDSRLRAMVKFHHLNLLNKPTMIGKADVVFCRNVLIYFDRATKIQVLSNIKSCMAPDGFLFLGASESLLGITDIFKPDGTNRGIYVCA